MVFRQPKAQPCRAEAETSSESLLEVVGQVENDNTESETADTTEAKALMKNYGTRFS